MESKSGANSGFWQVREGFLRLVYNQNLDVTQLSDGALLPPTLNCDCRTNKVTNCGVFGCVGWMTNAEYEVDAERNRCRCWLESAEEF